MKMHNFMCVSHECADPSSATYRVFSSLSSFARVNTTLWNVWRLYSQTCLKRPLKTDKTSILMTNGSLMYVEMYSMMLQGVCPHLEFDDVTLINCQGYMTFIFMMHLSFMQFYC